MIKNNNLVKIFAMMLMFLPLLLLSSCDEPPHEYTWGKWQFNENYHWREFDCCSSAVVIREWHAESEEHKDGLCDICFSEMARIKLIDINNLNENIMVMAHLLLRIHFIDSMEKNLYLTKTGMII